MVHDYLDFSAPFETNSITAMALEAARLGAWQVSTAGAVLWDKRTREIHGIDPNTPLTLEDTALVVHPDDREAVLQAIAQASLPEGPGYYEVEYRINREEPAPRWVGSLARVMKNNDIVVGFRGVVQDVTAHKHAEEARELLLKELNHRTKNILSVVQSLARTTLSDAGVSTPALRAYQDRLNALARCQGALIATEDRFSGDIHAVVAAAISPFVARTRENFRINGSHLSLNPDAVMTLSLVLHELLTNATKYGSLSTETGHVSLNWELSACGAVLDFAWCESGGPCVHPPAKPGFGSKLIHGLLCHNARDADCVRIEYLPAGVRCRLRVPL